MTEAETKTQKELDAAVEPAQEKKEENKIYYMTPEEEQRQENLAEKICEQFESEDNDEGKIKDEYEKIKNKKIQIKIGFLAKIVDKEMEEWHLDINHKLYCGNKEEIIKDLPKLTNSLPPATQSIAHELGFDFRGYIYDALELDYEIGSPFFEEDIQKLDLKSEKKNILDIIDQKTWEISRRLFSDIMKNIKI